MAFKTSSKQKLSTSSAVASSVGTGASGPVILSVAITDSSYVNLDDTAVSTSGGFIKLTGTGFVTGCIAYVNGVAATTTFVSSTEIRAVVPALASGTYSLMMFNSAGSGSLWASGLTTSGFPTVTTSSYSNQGNVLNIQLLASGDGTLVYTLQSGSTLPTGVTLSSSGILSGTATDLTSATVVSFTVLVNDAQLQTVQQAITLSLTFGDDYFKSTVLAIQSDVTPFISDASTNNLVLTPAGSVKANEANPFQDGFYSGYFNGTSDYLSMPSVAGLAFGAGDFTVEMWVNLLTGTTGPELFNHGNFHINFRSATTIAITNDASVLSNVSNAISLNTWTHIAAVRASGTMTIYINGVPNTPATGQTFTFTQGQTQIGSSNFASGSYANMYMSNLRVINGVALYTEAFTPPTAPLTTTEAAVTYVAPATVDYLVVAGGGGGASGGGGAGGMLTGAAFAVAANTALTVTVGTGGTAGNGDNFLGGNGGNSVFSTITATGGGGGGRSGGSGGQANNGGSGGGGGVNSSATGNPGTGISGQGFAGGSTGGFTGSPYGAGGGGGAGGVGTTATSAGAFSGGIGLQSSITGTAIYYAGGGASGRYTGTQAAAQGGLGGGGAGAAGSGLAGIDGIANTGGGGGGNASTITGGAGGSGVVIIRYADSASPAVTTGNPDIIVSGGYRIYRFTQSGTIKFRNTSSPAVTAAQTVLLTCQSNRFKDSSTTASAITVAGTPKITQVIPYTQPVNTYGSGYFDGSSYLTIPTNTALDLSTGDFTIECWSYRTTTFADSFIISSSGMDGMFFGFTGTTYIGYGRSGVAWDYQSATHGMAYNAWYHIALTRSGTSIKIFVNGIQVGVTQTSSQAYNLGVTSTTIGSQGAIFYHGGYFSNLRVVKGTALYTAAFTPPTAPLTAVTNTSLLTLQTKQAHNNNTYLETSSYNNLLTPSGTPSQGTFSPFSPAGWSMFGPSQGRLQLNTFNGPSFGQTADFTVEVWVNWTAPATGNETIWELTGTGRLIFGRTAAGIRLYNDGVDGNFNYTFVVGTWYHIALVRVSNYMRVYINGVLANTPYFNQTTWITTAVAVNCNSDGAETMTNSYISNLRMIQGTALYTSNFTPPIAALTAISGTILLTCQDNRFIDNSIYNNKVTAVEGPGGWPRLQPFSPFKPSAAYDPVIHGGSTYFNGSTDYLSAPVNTSLAFGAGATVSAMTAEAWFYVTTAISTDQTIVSQYASGGAGWSIRVYSSLMRVALQGDSNVITGTTTLVPYTWYHVALSGSVGSWKLFLNGVQESTTVTSYVDMGDSASVTIGRLSNISYFNGYISNLAITKGIAKYTGNFYVPTAPTPRTANTTLLLNSTSAAIIDASGRNNMLTTGDTKISTTIKKYGTGSVALNAGAAKLINNSSQDFGSGDFTVELWYYPTNAQTGLSSCLLVRQRPAWNYDAFILQHGSGTLYLYMSSSGGGWEIANNNSFGAIALNTWHHIALTRNGTNIRGFLNGVQSFIITTGATTTPYYNATQQWIVGQDGAGSNQLLGGYIDDLRITKGVARYVANFTPPTAISVS